MSKMINSLKEIAAAAFLLTVIALAAAAPFKAAEASDTRPALPTNITIINRWSGELPVAEFARLPEGQREASTRILKVILTDGIADIVAMETRSALPIEDKAAMAMAEIPGKGVRVIRTGKRLVPVRSDPENTSYRIKGHEIDLIDGRNKKAAAPGSASKITTTVSGSTAIGNLDDNGRPDAALVLIQNTGGTGTFFYVAAAINCTGGYRGTNSVFLGDRITVRHVSIRNGVIVVDYLDRRPGEPMAAMPTVAKSVYLTVRSGEPAAIGPLGEGKHLVEGWVTVGHEVRSFRPCGRTMDLWIMGNSPAGGDTMDAHQKAVVDKEPYTPVFMVLVGREVEAPREGFGADYPAGFYAARLVRVAPRGNCKAGIIVVDSPAPGETIVSPLTVSGRARGAWFFEGDFPMNIVDTDGSLIGQGYCTAKGPWMTDKFVPFEGTIVFKKPVSVNKGVLRLRKDNPTGLPIHDDALEIPVFIR